MCHGTLICEQSRSTKMPIDQTLAPTRPIIDMGRAAVTVAALAHSSELLPRSLNSTLQLTGTLLRSTVPLL